MDSVDLSKLLEKRFKKIKKHYHSLLLDFDENEIHDYRLEIKKLRALLRLINAGMPPEQQIKLGGKMKEFYGLTGNIRNLQLHQLRIRTYQESLLLSPTTSYQKALHMAGEQNRKDALSVAAKISFSNFENKILGRVQEGLRSTTVQNFVRQKQAYLVSLLSHPEYYDEDLHEVRKVLKDFLYDWSLITSSAFSLLPAVFSQQNLESLTSDLGNFHDLCVGLLFLDNSYSDSVDTYAEREILQHLQQELEWSKLLLKTNITNVFKQLSLQIRQSGVVENLAV